MYLVVPEQGIDGSDSLSSNGFHLSSATVADLPELVRLEKEIQGIERDLDYRYFLDQPDDLWHVSVARGEGGRLDGFLASCGSPVNPMLGPGCARSEAAGAALLSAELNRYPGRMYVFLVPVDCAELVQTAYRWGARNCEMHVAQEFVGNRDGVFFEVDRGVAISMRKRLRTGRGSGVVFPTFLPESG